MKASKKMIILLFLLCILNVTCSDLKVINDNSKIKFLNMTDFYDLLNKYNEKDLTTGFWFTIFESYFLIFVVEIADKTFVLLVFLSMRFNKTFLLVISGIFLTLMNVLAVLMGIAIPSLFYPNFIDWLSLILFLLYSVRLCEAAYHMESLTIYEIYFKSPDKPKQTKTVNKAFTLKRKRTFENIDKNTPLLDKDEIQEDIIVDHVGEIFVNDHNTCDIFKKPNTLVPQNESFTTITLNSDTSINYINPSNENNHQNNFEAVCHLISSLIIAECGGRTQITTIMISSVYDFNGVLIGTTFAKITNLIIAIFAGHILSKHITEKIIYYLEAVLFLLFAVQLFVLKMEYI